MTTLRDAAQQALEMLIESARLLGATQAKKGFGCYSEEDAMLERAWHQSIAKHSATLRDALAEQAEQEPVAWIRKNGFRFMGEIEPQDDSEVALYTAPQPERAIMQEPQLCSNCVHSKSVEPKCGLCCGPDSPTTKYERAVHVLHRPRQEGAT